MSLKSIVRELKEIRDGIGSSRRGNGSRRALSCSWSSKLQPCPLEEEDYEQGRWANMPPELLLDIIQRVEASEVTWPARRSVVSCSSVCRNWREIAKEVVRTPEECGRITFPISLKQPGRRDGPMQCFIQRERGTSTYRLYFGLSPSIQAENDKLLLAARRIRRATTTEFVISLSADDFSKSRQHIHRKLKSNFLGTKFNIYDSQPPRRRSYPKTPPFNPKVPLKTNISKSPSWKLQHINFSLRAKHSQNSWTKKDAMHSSTLSQSHPFRKTGLPQLQPASSTPSTSYHQVQKANNNDIVSEKERMVDFSSTTLSDHHPCTEFLP